MAADLATTPTSGLTVQLCGDAHLLNFGVFASPERHLVFDVNDFDESHPGPFEWAVKRLVASLEVAAREHDSSPKQRRTIVQGAARAYRETMREFATHSILDVWYAHLEMGEPRIISDPPLIVPVEDFVAGVGATELVDALGSIVRAYRRTLQPDRRHLLEQFRFVHMARKVVGVGSVGTQAWIVLLFDRDSRDPLFLQAKEAQPSVLEAYTSKSTLKNPGQRVVTG